MTRHDLIDQLSKLTPTDGEWNKDDNCTVRSNSYFIAEVMGVDNLDLITLAPQMRTAILDMAKEIEDLRDKLIEAKLYYTTPQDKCIHPIEERIYIGQNMLRCNICKKEFS